MNLSVEAIDAAEAPQWAAFWGVLDAAQRAEPDPYWSEVEWRGIATGADEAHVLLLIRSDGEPVGAAQLDLPVSDNLHLGWLSLGVVPSARRHGVGAYVLDAAAQALRQHGRQVLRWDVRTPTAGPESTGARFARRHGFAVGQESVRRELAVPLNEAQLALLEAQIQRDAQAYDVVEWGDRCPDQWLEDRAVIGAAMSTDAPLGDLVDAPERWDADRVRSDEDRLIAMARGAVCAGAVQRATGHLVALTRLTVPASGVGDAFQWDTLVLPEHRGHRLGVVVKIAALRSLQRQYPRITRVLTWNASTNTAMIDVNERLGFVPVERLWEMQWVVPT